MLSDEQLEAIGLNWDKISEKERSSIKQRVLNLRPKALKLQPFSHPELEIYRSQSEYYADDLARGLDLDRPDLKWPYELFFLEGVTSPAAAAIDAAWRHVQTALADTDVQMHAGVMHVLETASDLIWRVTLDDDENTLTADAVFSYGRRAIKEKASKAAASKNIEPRGWVVTEWAKRSDKGQSKASFARQYATLVKKKFGVVVLPDTISRDWLPKSKQRS